MRNLLWIVRQRGLVLFWGLVGFVTFLVTHWGLVLIPTVLLAVMLAVECLLEGPSFFQNLYWYVRSAWRPDIWSVKGTLHEDNLDEAAEMLVLISWAQICMSWFGKPHPREIGDWMDQNMEYELHEKLTCHGQLDRAASEVRGVLDWPSRRKVLIGLKKLEEAEIQGIKESLRLRY